MKFVCTLNYIHTDSDVVALQKGYHVFLEKPMSNKMEECISIEKVAEESGKIVTVCHVLRYTSFYGILKKLIKEGKVVITIEQVENIDCWHQAYTCMWQLANSNETSILIRQTSCHNLYIISWLIDIPCT